MCGICGIIGRDSSEESAATLSRMLRSIFHRGPDEEGTLIAPRFAAGIRRLSIIDLAGGTQPIWNETRTLAICFNGEIYNFRELRDELVAAGHQFRTHSDTEVILHVYEQWGTDGFARLHGMFAFVLAEMPEGSGGPVNRAILARDRFGIKPLYYSVVGGALVFASEVRALLASGLIPERISAEAVNSYLLFGSMGEPNTLVEGVFSLLPGHFVEIDVQAPAASLRSRPFWKVDFASGGADRGTSRGPRPNASAVSARVHSCLDHAVQSHLIADVPVGIFLSSGLDSTAIAALAARAHPGIHTFTVAFPDLEFSEADEARRTAERLGTQHSELRLSGEEMLARLDEAVAAFDQPSMDGINTYFVSWAAHQSGLKVALSGLGSDELFGGYPTFRTTGSVARLSALACLFTDPLRRGLVAAARAVRPDSASTPGFEKGTAAFLDPQTFPHSYFFTRALFTVQRLAASGIATNAGQHAAPWRNWLADCVAEAEQADNFTCISWLEMRSYMLSTLLRDTDSMSMTHSLEVRVPFLDPVLAEYILSLPESQKVGPGGPKSLLIRALGELLPENVANQIGRRKRTFTFPWEKWLRGPLRGRVSEGLANWSPALAQLMSRDFATRVWEQFQRGETTWSRPWSLYVLNEWAKRHLQSAQAMAPTPTTVTVSRS